MNGTRMKFWIIVLGGIFFALGILPGWAVAPKGLLVIEPFPGSSPKIIPFSTIQWHSAALGSIFSLTGKSLSFQCDSVIALVYFDEDYWQGIAATFLPYRQEIIQREVLLPVNHPNLLRAEDLVSLQQEIRAIEGLSSKYPSTANFLSSAKDQISRDIDQYQSGLRKLNGEWKTEKEMATMDSLPNGLSLTTKSGRHFENVILGHATAEGISVLLPSGATTIPLTDLPDAPEGWPPDALKKLNDLRQLSLSAAAVPPTSPIDRFAEVYPKPTLKSGASVKETVDYINQQFGSSPVPSLNMIRLKFDHSTNQFVLGPFNSELQVFEANQKQSVQSFNPEDLSGVSKWSFPAADPLPNDPAYYAYGHFQINFFTAPKADSIRQEIVLHSSGDKITEMADTLFIEAFDEPSADRLIGAMSNLVRLYGGKLTTMPYTGLSQDGPH